MCPQILTGRSLCNVAEVVVQELIRSLALESEEGSLVGTDMRIEKERNSWRSVTDLKFSEAGD